MKKDFGVGRDHDYCLTVPRLLYPRLSFLPASESEEQHKDLTLEGKVLYASRCMTLDKLCHSLQVNEGMTRELTACYTAKP